MTYINEYGEIVRESVPNDRADIPLSFFEGVFIFFYNYLLFIPGIILYFNHKKKGYYKKAKQVKTLMIVQFAILLVSIFLLIAAN